MKLPAENEIVSLRKIEYSDTQDIIRWRNSETVRTHFIYQNMFTKEVHEKWMRTQVETGKVVQMVILDKSEITEQFPLGKPVGSVYLRDIDLLNKKAEYGIFIGEASARGKGIGTAAARLMIDYGFLELNLHKVFLRVFADNKQAIRSYEKAGFVQEAMLKDEVCINGEFRDIVFMAIIHDDYNEITQIGE